MKENNFKKQLDDYIAYFQSLFTFDSRKCREFEDINYITRYGIKVLGVLNNRYQKECMDEQRKSKVNLIVNSLKNQLKIFNFSSVYDALEAILNSLNYLKEHTVHGLQ